LCWLHDRPLAGLFHPTQQSPHHAGCSHSFAFEKRGFNGEAGGGCKKMYSRGCRNLVLWFLR
jgi:hypothetical protein